MGANEARAISSKSPPAGAQAHAHLEPLPVEVGNKVVLDLAAAVLHVDRRILGNPALLTWVSRARARGIELTLEACDVERITNLRLASGQTGLNPANAQLDELAVRNYALDLIATAARYGASDVHFMLRGDIVDVQIVVKGGLRVLHQFSQAEAEPIVRAIYQGIAKQRSASYNPLEFQNAQIAGSDLGIRGVTSIRIVRGPAYPQASGGAFMTMRIQYAGAGKGVASGLPPLALPKAPPGRLELDRMGYTAAQIDKLVGLMSCPNGIVLFTGPTGSGKTTTMFEMLQHLARVKAYRRQVTIEDPVEYPMSWAVQLTVPDSKTEEEAGMAFLDRVRVSLRMAPHIILIGEIRGPEVALAAINAAITGHLAISTLHVSDPFQFVERLEFMDQKRLNRGICCDHKVIRGVVAQRLLPVLCEHCRVPLSRAAGVSARLVEALSTWGAVTQVHVKGPGCEHCGGDGETGRVAIAEIVMMDAQVMEDFIERGTAVARQNYRARTDADPSLMAAAIARVLRGEVDPVNIEDFVDGIEVCSGRGALA